jgi:general secretion pathway protein E
MRQLIYENANEQTILQVARKHYPGIESDGRRRILAGETSVEEVMRVTSIA